MLLAELTSVQWSEWLAYYAIQPWDALRGEAQAALLACMQYNANRAKGAPDMNVADFLVWARKERPKPISLEEKLMAMFGKQDGNRPQS